MCTLWQQEFMRRDYKAWQMPLGKWEVPSGTTTNSYPTTLILSKCHVKWWWQMLPVSGIRTHGMPLPTHKMFWLWWIWPCHSRLPRQNSTIWCTCKAQKYPFQCKMPDRPTSHHDHRDRHRPNRSRSHSCSHRYRSHSWNNSQGVTPGHTTDMHTGAHHATDTQAHITINETLHIEDLHHTEVFPPIQEIAVDLDHIHCTKTTA